MRWQDSNDRASLDRFIAEVELESTQLQRQIEAARARVQDARAAATRRADATADFGALLLVAQNELERIEREHREILEAIGAAAREEAARLVAAACDSAAAIRTGSLPAGGSGPAIRSAADGRNDR